MEKVEGKKIRARSEKFKDFYSQAKLFWNSMSEPEKKHIIEAFHFEIGKVNDKNIRKAIVDMFNNVDGDLAIEIAKGVGVPAPDTERRISCNKRVSKSQPGALGTYGEEYHKNQKSRHSCCERI